MGNPPFLKNGDKIGIVSPSGRIEEGKLDNAIRIFKEWGLNAVTGGNVYSSYNQFGGSDEQRAADLQSMLDDESVKAIVCSRGGYGTVRIIDRIDFSRFVENPKWIVGYSDITVLHSHINKLFGIETIHSPMAAEMAPGRKEPLSGLSLQLLKDTLFGKLPVYNLPVHPLSVKGEAGGILTGGNLSVLCSLSGSRSDNDFKGKILFIEDIGEYLYHVDRMLWTLSRSGVLGVVAGLVIGGMTDMNDNKVPFGFNAEEIISQAVSGYGYPVCFGFPAGHQSANHPLILGRRALLRVGDDTCSLSYSE
jgi:muramoyltetrapeptide carboxypeptidase